MKSLQFLLLPASLCFGPGTVAAESKPAPLPRMAGVQISLTTSSSRIVLPPSASGAPVREPVLTATVVLANRGPRPVPFQFRDEAAARTKFVFSVFNAADEVVWSGPGQVIGRIPPVAAVGQSLNPRAPWTASVRVPLRRGDTPWEPGFYRIEAVLDATPTMFAAGAFEVAPSPGDVPVRPVPQPLPPVAPSAARVLSVDALSVVRVTLPGGAPGLRVEASGTVNSGGWSAPRLVERPAIAIFPPPPLAFDFVATPPSGMATMALAPVRAFVELPWPPGASAVTVHAASNALSRPVPAAP
jgi:hypothetical protein